MNLAQKLTTERRSRLAAERMLELKQAELFAANRKLGQHAQQLTEEIVETRAEVETIRGENQRVKSDLTAANQKIEITERRLWQSIETINDGFAFFNVDNEMIMANRSYLAIFEGLEDIRPGVNYATILQVLTDEGIVNTGDLCAKDWRQMMTRRLQDPKPAPIVIELWDGNHIKLIDQRGPDGDMVSLGLNITATVAYEQQLEEARANAESANRAKSTFLANMSHEIRTPMNGVVGMADVLKETELDEEQQLYVDTIRNSGEALLVIINDVLDYSKIEAKKLELHPEPFDLERAIQEILMLLQPSAQAKGLTLALDYDLFLPASLIGDPGRIRQALTNLVGNAVKFTAEGHVLVRVTGVPDETTQQITLHVTIEDTGIGIPEDMVDHIFGEFNQVENERNRKFDGTGLGLAITQRLVEMMGGQIWVTSTDGVGSCFGFRVTLDVAEAATPAAPPELPNGPVLVITKVEITRKLLEHQLRQLEVDVTACATLGEGLAACETAALILVDEDLGGMNFAEHLHEKGLRTPVVVLSSRPVELERHPDRAQVQGILPAPPPRKELLEMLSEFSKQPDPVPPAQAQAKAVPMFVSRARGSATPIAEPASDHESKVEVQKDANPAPLQALRQLRVLAAEDNKTNQLVFRKMIKALNVALTFANNGEEAVAQYQEIVPDIVFMDISMPRMDGKEATQAIRALEQSTGKHVPVVAMTAHAMDGDSEGILAAGLDHYLTKPLRKPDIIARIEDVHDADMLPLHSEEEG